MYVFYENYIFKSRSTTQRSVGYYTHRVTVHEDCSIDDCIRFKKKYGKICNYNSTTKKIYIRETLRIARINKTVEGHKDHDPSHHRASVRNFGLDIFITTSRTDGETITSRGLNACI